MEKVIIFIVRYYSWIVAATVLLIFALVGYIVDSKREKNDLFKKNEREIEEENIESLIIPEDKSLSESINVSKNINPETKKVELVDSDIINDNTDSN